jgi:predicted transcriptional regulator
MSKYRHRIEIYASLLRAAAAEKPKGISITRLMYASEVSYHQMTRHLEVLLKERLLENSEQKKVCKITARGLQSLELYAQMAEMLKPLS